MRFRVDIEHWTDAEHGNCYFEFESEEEMKGFVKGVEMAIGWGNWRISGIKRSA